MTSKQSETQSYLGALAHLETSPRTSSNPRSRRALPSSPDGVSLQLIQGQEHAPVPKSAPLDPFRKTLASAMVTINRWQSTWEIPEVRSGKYFLLSTDHLSFYLGLTRMVITSALIATTFRTLKRNHGAEGIDKVSLSMFKANLPANLADSNAASNSRLLHPVPSTLGLVLSPEKIRITTYDQGIPFCGFHLSRRSRRIRDILLRTFKQMVRELTPSRERGGRGPAPLLDPLDCTPIFLFPEPLEMESTH